WRFRWKNGWLLHSKQDAYFVTANGKLLVTAATPFPNETIVKDGIMAAIPFQEKLFLPGARKSYFFENQRLTPIDHPDWGDLLLEHLVCVMPWNDNSTIIRLGGDGGLQGFDSRTLSR